MSQIGILLELLCRPGLAGGTDLVGRYEQAFARTVLGDASRPCLAFGKGRVALWTVLRALASQSGGEVAVPAFTCEMVPAAVKFAGLRCVYADVAAGGFNAGAAELAGAIGPATQAVVCQHTYGIGPDPAAMRRLSTGGSAVLIEDCCQLADLPAGPDGPTRLGAVAFFSTQWNKPFSTGLGGMAAFNDSSLYSAVGDMRSAFGRAGDRARSRSLAIQALAYELTVRPATQAAVAKMYRFAQRRGWVRGTNTAGDYDQTMPDDYPCGATNLQAILGLRQLRRWDSNVAHRRMLTGFYLQRLAEFGIDTMPLGATCGQALWAVPLLVDNKAELLARAERDALAVATWFDVPPVHLAEATAGWYDYRPGSCPASEWMVPREIHLPTSPAVSLDRAQATWKFLQRHARFTSPR